MANQVLQGLKFIVVGAGPAGLTFAKAASQHGAQVVVIERAGNPDEGSNGYTDRSFNLTLNNVGRAALNDERVISESVEIKGRAMHNFNGTGATKYVNYGEGDSAVLTSITRPTLREQLMRYTQEAGAHIRFRTKVAALDPDTATVTTVAADSGDVEYETGDLVVIADGLHSLADSYVEAMPGGSLHLSVEPYNYVTVVLAKELCRGLSVHHINFWHNLERESVSIGVPIKDGSIAVLMISRFNDVPKDQSPFATLNKSIDCLRRDFPQLLALDPELPARLAGRKRGRFYYKSISNYMIGQKAVVVGDAGIAVPPWAAFGANTGIYGADALVRFLVGSPGNITTAMIAYENHEQLLARLVADFVDQQGQFLSHRVAEHPDERRDSPMLGYMVNQVVRTLPPPPGVQLLSFDEPVPASELGFTSSYDKILTS